jgi:hypothetical protein
VGGRGAVRSKDIRTVVEVAVVGVEWVDLGVGQTGEGVEKWKEGKRQSQ